MGSRDLTDGEWGWPAGLAHYVEAHGVIPPEEFFNRMRWHEWRAPAVECPRDPAASRGPGAGRLEFSFWARRLDRCGAFRYAPLEQVGALLGAGLGGGA